jgi:toxin YhaV
MPSTINGWNVYFHPIFLSRKQELRERVNKVKKDLGYEAARSHSAFKLLEAVMLGIKEKITSDPFASYFALTGELRKYKRLKKMGLPDRYRLFFKVDNQKKAIVILWLGYPRKEGDKNDCYEVFKKMVARGEFPENFDQLIAMCN